MNFLSPDENIHNGVRRKSLCNGVIMAVSNGTLSKKKERVTRRGSLSEPPCRRASLVQRWFKHISDAADAYKSRTKGNHELTEDPASTTLSNSSTKESLEGTPEKELNTSTSSKVSLLNNNKEDESQVIGDEPNNNSNNKDDLLDRDESGGDSCNKNDMDRNENENDDVDVKVRKREYSNNSNNTRTLTQQNSLVAPSEVHVSVSPALTAEPVLTPNERLRRLDESIRITLAEKQQVVCDMFRVPNEHFTAIADIVGQPEAPKDPSDIVLAAFAQVQSLTETLNEYIKVTQHQEISAVSTSLCDECHKNSQLNRGTSRSCSSSSQSNNSLTNTSATTTATTVRNGGGVTTGLALLERLEHVTDDDGYCEIDDIRLPTVIAGVSSTIVATAVTVVQTSAAGAPPLPAAAATPELKRQSTISADSIPEETEHEINAESLATSTISEIVGDDCADSTVGGAVVAVAAAGVHIEINNDTYDSTSQQLSAEFNPEDSESIISDNQHRHLLLTNSCSEISCGANRLAHATALAPAVPCHLIASSITTLNLQISQLLPKINEGDIEREKLRKENQHLRELLNSMHERERVSNERETPDRALESRQLTSQDSND